MPASRRKDMKMNLKGLRKLIREEYSAIRAKQQLLSEGPIADTVQGFIAIVNDMPGAKEDDALEDLLRLSNSLTPVQAKRVMASVPGWPARVKEESDNIQDITLFI